MSKITRRKFIQGVGTGVIGSSVVIGTMHAGPKQAQKRIPEGSEGLFLKVNGKTVNLKIDPETTLIEVLRDFLHLTGTKLVCNQGECGACTVLLDGVAVYSCHMLALDAAGKEVTTIEGLFSTTLNVTYTYNYGGKDCEAMQSFTNDFVAFIPWIGIILLVVAAAIVLGVVISSFAGSRKGRV